MKLEELKKHYFNEDSLSLSAAKQEDIQQLAVWLEDNGYDPDYAWTMYDMGCQEMRHIMADAASEFAELM